MAHGEKNTEIEVRGLGSAIVIEANSPETQCPGSGEDAMRPWMWKCIANSKAWL